jgi:hypothetical protein
MATQNPVEYTVEEKTLMAKVAYRQAQLGGRGDDVPEHELDDAIYYVDMALVAIKARNSYDPQAYAREYGKSVLIEYTRLLLLGQQPFINPNFLLVYDGWLKAAAQERYSGRPDSWPNFPRIRQRLRTHDLKEFEPDGQTEDDF